MSADYRINLARELTSSGEERQRFYNGMLIYLALCSAVLVLTAYLSAVNLKRYIENKRELSQLLATASAITGMDVATFKHPDKVYQELELYAGRLASSKQALSAQVRLLPVVHNLFESLPEGVALLNLSANRKAVSFGLAMPMASEESGDPVRKLKAAWEGNPALMEKVAAIRPVTGERRSMGSTPVFFMQFECTLR